MFIQTEQTPNPATLKFLPGKEIIADGTANFQQLSDAKGISPLAEALFSVRKVTGVFLGKDFITITKASDAEWMELKPMVLGAMIEFLTSDKSIMIDGVKIPKEIEKTFESDDIKAIVEQIKELLDTRVRPAVAQDGGDIVFHDYDDGIVFLTMLGACEDCPSSTATLKMGIENMLKYYIPEIIEVRAIS